MSKLNKHKRIKIILGGCLLLVIFTVFSFVKDELRKSKSILRFVNHNEVPEFVPKPSTLSQNLVKSALKHDKWIVITTIANPTVDVKFLASIPGWKVVVVGDTKTPQNWSHPNCVFLDIQTQESLGLSITTKLPYNSYSRKNAGYLYAIAHGAKYIYETDDDNRPLDKLKGFQYNKKTSGLMFAGRKLFNPYRHFGQSTLWPRGYPLSAIGNDDEKYYYRASDSWDTPIIQQGLVNGDPDMDAIFRLTRKKMLVPLTVKFDPAAPPAILPEGVFSPFNSQNTFFFYEAFWALYLPSTTTFRISDIWRSYWAQRLMWEIGGHLGFYPANAYQMRNSHSYLLDAESEKDMYFLTESLIQFLIEWTCPIKYTFFQCACKLAADMAIADFWKDDEVEITKAWLDDLISLNYTEPRRLLVNSTKHREQLSEKDFLTNSLQKRKEDTINKGTPVIFYAVEQAEPTNLGTKPPAFRPISQVYDFMNICPKIHINVSHLEENDIFNDVLLIIVFDWPFYTYIPHLETLWRFIFPNLLYCGEDTLNFEFMTKNMKARTSFLEVPKLRGLHNHKCAIHAMEMGYDVKGYLIVSDDDLVNVWNLKPLDNKKIWMSQTHITDLSEKTKDVEEWWLEREGAHFQKAMEALSTIDHVPDDVMNVSTFRTQMNASMGGNLVVTGEADLYYVPASKARDFRYYASHFAKYNVFQKITVPTILTSLSFNSSWCLLDGYHLKGRNERSKPWLKYEVDKHFVHPVNIADDTNRAKLCTDHMNNLLLNYWSPKKKEDSED